MVTQNLAFLEPSFSLNVTQTFALLAITLAAAAMPK
jgi:hypothetical protein